MARWIAPVVLFVLSAPCAYADSDGYYCVGPDYIAYQFAVPSTRPHRLYVVRVGGAEVIGATILFDLPSFQVHGMRCGDREIQLAAFDAVYSVALDSDRRPIRFSTAPLPKHGDLPLELTRSQQNLGGWSKPVASLKVERVAVGKPSAGNDVFLEITPRPSTEPCVTEITTRLIAVDRTGRALRERRIFTGFGRRECGENE